VNRGGGELCECWLALRKSVIDQVELAELHVALDDRSGVRA
jgi:hypothetical protein